MTTRSKYCETMCGGYGTGDCDGCPDRPPKLMSENRDALILWNASYTQWRVCFGSVYGLDYPAVKSIAEGLDRKIYPAMIRKMKRLEFHELKRFAEEAKTEAGDKNE